MILNKWLVAGIGLGVCVAGCSGSDSSKSGDPTPVQTTDPKGLDYENEQVLLDTDLVIPAGTTVHVGEGVTFAAAANVKIRVEGTLVVDASAESPTLFVAQAGAIPKSWVGIEIASGGKVDLKHIEIEGGQYGIHALPGSTYTVDHAEIGTTFKAAVLEADGSFDHSTFHAITPDTVAITIDVTIDDPNGTMTIMGASPTVSNSVFEGAAAFTDMVRVGGDAGPVFDHVRLKGAHCAFHVIGAKTKGMVVKNSIIENMSFGVMAFAAKPTFEKSNFLNNTNDIGYCFGAQLETAPVVTGNYYLSGEASIDASCFQVKTTATDTVTEPIDGAGPVGL